MSSSIVLASRLDLYAHCRLLESRVEKACRTGDLGGSECHDADADDFQVRNGLCVADKIGIEDFMNIRR